ncbi:hypothetical protein AP75_01875 [Kaistella haifensis DSM 19056]|uniref:Phage protein D n=1 Tax=Kaistella haifensis DSM 19056 TaxID=1450526 RepID=A0A246BD05_9FLAO|nr:hypothetical protein [Kaistella haifensis]OWK99259.1 hypothetical protein AP75_01875 [Kaistella haifensis DSM 19056]
MAFYLTSSITIGDYKNIKPNKVTWKTDVGNFVDTCTITLPRRTHMINENPDKTLDLEGRKIYQFKEGDKVEVLLGYNNKNERRFSGFIRRVKMGIPVELECEGYASQLHNIIFNKTYANVTVKQLLKDLTAGTDIKLSNEIPEIPLKNVRFKNATGIQVLEYLKKEVSLAVYFNFNELFVGTVFGKVQKRIRVKIGWNTVRDDDFQKRKVEKNLKIVVREKNAKGEVKRTKSDLTKYDNEKDIKIKADIPVNFLKEIVNRLQTQEDYKGYEGDIQLFLAPYANKGMVIELHGGMYPEKTGDYFIQSVQGEFGMSGGRQTVQLGFIMNR